MSIISDALKKAAAARKTRAPAAEEMFRAEEAVFKKTKPAAYVFVLLSFAGIFAGIFGAVAFYSVHQKSSRLESKLVAQLLENQKATMFETVKSALNRYSVEEMVPPPPKTDRKSTRLNSSH